MVNKLLEILNIAHNTSMRGEGLSLRDALTRSEYDKFRERFGPSDLMPLLRDNCDLMKQWIMYSKDKRTVGGYWIAEDSCAVGTLESPEATIRYESLEQAVAEFVVRELDFWSGVNKQG